jgi:hypothetical protein
MSILEFIDRCQRENNDRVIESASVERGIMALKTFIRHPEHLSLEKIKKDHHHSNDCVSALDFMLRHRR